MAISWQSLGEGVRCYESKEVMTDPADKRKRRPVRMFYLKYSLNGKAKDEAIGPETLYSEQEVFEIARTLKRNRKDGVHPFTWNEWKEERNAEYERNQEEARLAECKTFGKFYESVYLPLKQQQVAVGKISEKYLKNLRSLCETWAIPVIGSMTFDAIKSEHFDDIVVQMLAPIKKQKRTRIYNSNNPGKKEYKTELVMEPARSVTTTKTVRAILHEIWDKACDKEFATKTFPGKEMASIKYDNKRTRIYTDDEMQSIFAELKKRSIDTYHIAVIAAYTGLRASTICKLTWGEIDDSMSKTSKNKENVGLGMFSVNETLKEIIAERRIMHPESTKKDYIFKRQRKDKDKKTDSALNAVSRTYARVLEDLGINRNVVDIRDRGCFHTLRHTCASLLVQNGMSLEKIGKILGHRTPSMTFRYSHHDDTIYDEASRILMKKKS